MKRFASRPWLYWAGALSLLGLALRAALPVWAAVALSERVERSTGRALEIADVDLSLLRGFVRLEGLRFAGESLDAPSIAAASARTNLEWLDLLRGEVHLREIVVVDPQVELVRDPNGGWVPLVELVADEGDRGVVEDGEGRWAITVDRVATSHLEVRIRSQGERAAATDPLVLDFEVEALALSSAVGHRAPLEIAVDVAEGRALASGTLGLSPFSYGGDLRWSSIDLASVTRVFADQIPVALAGGATSGALTINLAEGGAATVAGQLAIVDLALRDDDETFSAAAAKIEVDAREVRVSASAHGLSPQIDLARVSVRAPLLSLRRSEATVSTAGEPTSPAESSPGSIGVEVFELREGRFVWLDTELEGNQELVLDAVRADATGLRFPRRGVGFDSLRADARVASGGQVSLRGRSEDQRGSSVLEIAGLDLRALRGYAKRAGYELREGSLDLESEARFGSESIALENHVVLGDLAVENESGGFEAAVGLPLDVALALLRDPTGAIGLRIPVTVERGESDLHLAATLRSALRQALVGALTTPLKAAGFLIPGEGSQLRNPFQQDGVTSSRRITLRFAEGSTALEADALEGLERLASFLRERPSVRLRVEGRYAESEARAPELPRVAAEDPPTLLERAVDVLRVGRRRQEESFPSVEVLAPPTATPLELAEARAERVFDTLTREYTVPTGQLIRDGAVSGGAEVVLELRLP